LRSSRFDFRCFDLGSFDLHRFVLGCFGLVRVHRTRRGAACGTAGKWKQSDVAGALDGNAEPTLVTGADTLSGEGDACGDSADL
jgi:hypothetical protein